MSRSIWLGLGCIACAAKPDDEAPPPVGTVEVCTEIPADNGEAHDVRGRLARLDAGDTACDHDLTVVDAAGQETTVGWSVSDDFGADVSLPLSLAVDDFVDLRVRSVLVWGDVQGLTVVRDGQLILAVEEGTWGGALEEADLGFSVTPGDEVFVQDLECETRTTVQGVFTVGSEALVLEPLSTGSMTMGDSDLSVLFANGTQRGPGQGCAMSDQTDVLSWMAGR